MKLFFGELKKELKYMQITKLQYGVVHILRNQPRGGGGFQMLTVDYGGGGGVWSLIT